MTTMPKDGVNALFWLHAALRLKEKTYPHDSRVVLASLQTGFGLDFEHMMRMGLLQMIAGHQQVSSSVGKPDAIYRPYLKRNGEQDESATLEQYSSSLFSNDEQQVLETKLKSLVLANPTDDIDRIRFFQGGKININKEPDLEKIAKDLKNFYADEKTIPPRLGISHDAHNLAVIPLQVRLDYVKMWDDAGTLEWHPVSVSMPKLPKDYLSAIPSP